MPSLLPLMSFQVTLITDIGLSSPDAWGSGEPPRLTFPALYLVMPPKRANDITHEMEAKLRGTNEFIICLFYDSCEAEEGVLSPVSNPGGTAKKGRPVLLHPLKDVHPQRSSGQSLEVGRLEKGGRVGVHAPPTFPGLITHMQPVSSPSRTPCGCKGLLSSVGGRSRPLLLSSLPRKDCFPSCERVGQDRQATGFFKLIPASLFQQPPTSSVRTTRGVHAHHPW